MNASAYHGECDSFKSKQARGDRTPGQDALVGHAFGDRPLLADDELDDTSPQTTAKRPARLKTGRLNSVPLPLR